MESLVAANIRSRPTRTMISVSAVGLGVVLMLIIGGIATGTLNDYLDRNVSLGADFLLQPAGASIFTSISQGALPVKLADKLYEVPGVSIVAPVLLKFSMAEFGTVFGIELESYNRFPGRLRMVAGRAFLDENEAIVDELFAEAQGVGVGDTLSLFNHDFVVGGICKPGTVVRVFVPLKTLQVMNGDVVREKATMMFIKADKEVGAEEVYRRLKERYPQLTITRTSDRQSMLANTRVPAFREFKLTVVFISMVLSFMVILLAMYSTIFERTREIGILKSLGATRAFIVGLILKESVIICLLGVAFGIGVSALVRLGIIVTFPTLQVAWSLEELATASLLGLTGGTIGALYPAYRASRQDPVQSLSYE